MTREEAINNLNMISVAFAEPVTKEQRKLIDDTFDMAIKALEESETVTEFADRCRECGAKYGKLLKQWPCEDAVSRQAVDTLVDELARAISDERCCISRGRSTATIMRDILELPPVNPQESKIGHWIHRTQDGGCFWEECSVCHTERAFSTKYCPDCGTYMYADIR